LTETFSVILNHIVFSAEITNNTQTLLARGLVVNKQLQGFH